MYKAQWLVRLLSVVSFFIAAAITKDLFQTMLCTLLIFVVLQWLSMKNHLKKRNELRNASLDEIDTMEGVQFERYLYELFIALGYKVQRTSKTGDFGADLILDDGDSKTVVQAKRYKGNVGIQAVQEVFAAKSYYDADYAWVVTNSSYTNAAYELAERSGVSLYCRRKLSDLMTAAGIEKPSENEIKRSFEVVSKEKCPLCSSPMVLRKGRNGVFYGCKTFPKCKGTKKSK